MFHLDISTAVGKEFAPLLRENIFKARSLIASKLQDLSIALVNDRTMIRLHDEYMNLATPTDVLTFPLEVDRTGRAVAGEVIICVPEARRAAKLQGTGIEDELLLYAVHGMLHLSGFDDRTAADFARMHAMEDKILTKLGVGRVFDRAAVKVRRADIRGKQRKGVCL